MMRAHEQVPVAEQRLPWGGGGAGSSQPEAVALVAQGPGASLVLAGGRPPLAHPGAPQGDHLSCVIAQLIARCLDDAHDGPRLKCIAKL